MDRKEKIQKYEPTHKKFKYYFTSEEKRNILKELITISSLDHLKKPPKMSFKFYQRE